MWNKNGLKPWNWRWNEKGEQISCQIALDDAGFDKSNNNSLPDCVLTTLCVAIDSCQIRGWLPAVYNTWSNNKRQCWSTSNNHNRFIIALDRYDHISYFASNLFEVTWSMNTIYVIPISSGQWFWNRIHFRTKNGFCERNYNYKKSKILNSVLSGL